MESVNDFLEASKNCILQCIESIFTGEMSMDLVIIRLESIVFASDEFLEVSSLSQSEKILRVIPLLESVIADISAFLNLNVFYTKTPGRPKIEIDLNAVESLLAMNFTAKKISAMYGVSTRTLHRRLHESGTAVRNSYTQISAADLEDTIKRILVEFPNTGYKRMRGFLMQQGIKVTELTVCEVMRIADPEGVYQRTCKNRAIVRRVYFVKFSNDMWHIDTHLKLIRWGFVIRGGIDGKSRTCVYLEAGTDNKAESNMQAFLQGVGRYGVPFRCRSDKGRENVLVAQFMLQNRGLNRASHICGRSVHNQRIERFWRDVQYGCTTFYRTVFIQLEQEGLLDVENMLDLFVLHLIFIPRINRHLQMFMEGWNMHPLSTENNRSPHQLMLENLPPPHYDIHLMQSDLPQMADTGINNITDLSTFDNEQDSLTNPIAGDFCLTPEQEAAVAVIDPLEDSETYGCDLYTNCLNILRSLM